MDDDAMNIAGSLQPHALPGFAAIETLVDTGTCVVGISRIALSRTNPYYIRILLIDRYSANRLYSLFVEDGRPGNSAIEALPDPPGGGSGVDDIGIAQIDINGRYTAAHTCRPDIARLERIKKRKLQWLRQQHSRQRKQCTEEHRHPFFHTVRL